MERTILRLGILRSTDEFRYFWGRLPPVGSANDRIIILLGILTAADELLHFTAIPKRLFEKYDLLLVNPRKFS